MAKVRRAGAADLSILVEMGRALHAESPRYRGMRYDPDKVRRLARELTGNLLAELGAVFVAEEAGEVVGVAAVVAAERWFGPDRYVTDLTMYVKPEHRGGSAFVKLVKALEDWAAQQGVQDIDLGVSTDVHTDRTVRAYERLGYTLSPTRIITKKLHHGD